jgi:hypothetical protein
VWEPTQQKVSKQDSVLSINEGDWLMPGETRIVEIDKDDIFHVSVSAHVQSFRYLIDRYAPDGSGGFLAGQRIGRGDNGHSQWLGKGADIEGSMVRVAVTHGGHTETSIFEIVVRLLIERSSDMFEDVGSWRIKPGLDSGEYSFVTLLFK